MAIAAMAVGKIRATIARPCAPPRLSNAPGTRVSSAIALAEAGDVAAVYACAGYTRRMCDEVERLQAEIADLRARVDSRNDPA